MKTLIPSMACAWHSQGGTEVQYYGYVVSRRGDWRDPYHGGPDERCSTPDHHHLQAKDCGCFPKLNLSVSQQPLIYESVVSMA